MLLINLLTDDRSMTIMMKMGLSKIVSTILSVAFVIAALHLPTAVDSSVLNQQSPPMRGAATSATISYDVIDYNLRTCSIIASYYWCWHCFNYLNRLSNFNKFIGIAR